ncbi:MAG: hypothetical protein ACP5TO_03175 [Thermoplasmata archaeon]
MQYISCKDQLKKNAEVSEKMIMKIRNRGSILHLFSGNYRNGSEEFLPEIGKSGGIMDV